MPHELNYWTRLEASRFSRRQVLRGAALGGAGLAAAALVGCGGDEAAKAPAPQTGSPATSNQGAAGKPGGRLQLYAENDPPTLDPHGSAVGALFMDYNQLVQHDPMVSPRKPDGVIPDLAKAWETAPDGM